MMSRSSSSSRIIKNNNLFHLLKSFIEEFGGAIIVLIRAELASATTDLADTALIDTVFIHSTLELKSP